jgi:prepilin-type processing-associated H-X9-DG protein
LTNGSGEVISYCLIGGLPGSIPLETTPVAFTRGLKENGLWDEKAGLYGSKGGLVAFADGHVTWFDGSKPAKFLKWDQSGYAVNIREAIPDEAYISSGWNLKTGLKSSQDDSLIILNQCRGIGGN